MGLKPKTPKLPVFKDSGARTQARGGGDTEPTYQSFVHTQQPETTSPSKSLLCSPTTGHRKFLFAVGFFFFSTTPDRIGRHKNTSYMDTCRKPLLLMVVILCCSRSFSFAKHETNQDMSFLKVFRKIKNTEIFGQSVS